MMPVHFSAVTPRALLASDSVSYQAATRADQPRSISSTRY